MKKIKKIRLIIEISLLLIFTLSIASLTTSTIQNLLADYIAETLSESLNAEMQIGKVRIRHLNHFELDDVSLRDQQGEKMVSFGELDARLKLLPLLKGEISFQSIELDGLNANLYITNDSVMNLQFLIDFFPTDTTLKTPDIKLSDVIIKDANVRYRDWRDTTDIDIRNVNTELSFELKDESKIKAELKSLSLCWKNEHIVRNLKAKAIITDRIMGVRDLQLDLRNSHIKLDAAKIGLVHKEGTKDIDWGKCSYLVNLSPSIFTPQDISCFAPALINMNRPVHFELDAKGTIDNIKTKKIHIDYDNNILFDANLQAQNITDLSKLSAKLNIQDLRFNMNAVNTLIGQITGRPSTLPKSLNNLGVCCYRGRISGSLDKIGVVGKLTTAQGNITTSITLVSPDTLRTCDIQGTINTTTIDVGKLIDNPELGLGPTELKISTKASFGDNGLFNVGVNGQINKVTFKNYTYKNLSADCFVSNKAFNGHVRLEDKNARLNLDGHVSLDKKKEFIVKAKIDSVKLGQLNLGTGIPDVTISLGINSDINLYDINSINGVLDLTDLHINGNGQSYSMDNMHVLARNDNDTNFIDVQSSLINGSIYGHYRFDDIYPNLMNTISKNLPKLSAFCHTQAKYPTDLTATFDIEPLQNLMLSLGIPWYTTETTTFHTSYKSATDRLTSYLIVPHVTNGVMSIDSTILNINNHNQVNINLRTSSDMQIGHINGNLRATIDHGLINTSLAWNDELEDTTMFGGELYAKTTFNLTNGKIEPQVEIMPTQFVLHGTPWQFGHAHIDVGYDRIRIDHFSLKSEDGQIIAANGNISNSANDSLTIYIKDLMLEYVSEMLPKETSIAFGGKFSARGNATQLLSAQPHINLNASATPFSFNHAEVGNMKAEVNFNSARNNLGFYATVFTDSSVVAALDGHYFFNRDSLDILGHANGLNLSIIDMYIKDVFGTLAGNGYGDVHIYSVGKDVAIDGDIFGKDASLGVNFLNTRFYFNDSIHISRNIISFPHIALSDKEGGKGTLNGYIKHNFFKDMKFNLLVHCDTMLALNTTKAESSSFYGKVFASGDISISGDDRELNITGRIKSEPKSQITLSIDNYAATENSFITFVQPAKITSLQKEEKQPNSSNLLVNLMIEVTPQTAVSLVTNSKSGDKLDASVNGNLRLTYDVNNADMKLYGDLGIVSGKYTFTMQEIIRKEFKFRNGGTIKWTGDVGAADLNIEGYYQLNANVKDLLDESALINFDRTTVPVQCVLKITGKLTQPEVNFGIDLPNSDDELKRLVQTAINTPEKLYREVVALLLLGKFVKAESLNNSSFISENELYSAVSTTISAQLNNWASQMFDNVGFGVNIRKAESGTSSSNTNMEYEFNFQYAPTDRILINGNVGYRDVAASSNGSKFIGDFDFEYKLTEAGEFRIKAYTHTNDYKEFKKGLTTQGVGLVWTESFKNAKDLRETIKAQAEKGKRNRAAFRKRCQERKKKNEEKRAAKKAAKAAALVERQKNQSK